MAYNYMQGYQPNMYAQQSQIQRLQKMLEANSVPYDTRTLVRYYLTMNMYGNDAKQVAEENNMPVDKFCFVMAKSFINDVDANKYKVEKYFTETI